ncbi:conserved protein of unknown function [Tenacibaculum sp. 190130A14a]|uniref:Glyoxalase-like domain-containing protein n=1 Tax=Tenacibaculum polynesiense TaxID=3137857 RepID=A0ABM9PEY1_9FLAO
MKYIYIIIIIFGLSSCKKERTSEPNPKPILQHSSPDIKLDHFNIWVDRPEKAKQKLEEIGFYAVPDSLSTVHVGQGTTGKYFYFLNSYLELIFPYNQEEFDKNNKINHLMDFYERANHTTNGASPFGLALKIKDYDLDKVPFNIVAYHQNWMKENASIYAAKNSKINLKEPSIFIVYPEIESDVFQTMDDLKNIPEEYSFVRTFYKHPNGAQKVTKIHITSNGLNSDSKTIKTINNIEKISTENGKEHLMELYFDNGIQNKSFDLRPELPIIIHL